MIIMITYLKLIDNINNSKLVLLANMIRTKWFLYALLKKSTLCKKHCMHVSCLLLSNEHRAHWGKVLNKVVSIFLDPILGRVLKFIKTVLPDWSFIHLPHLTWSSLFYHSQIRFLKEFGPILKRTYGHVRNGKSITLSSRCCKICANLDHYH